MPSTTDCTIMKFGGTSLGSGDRIQNAAQLIQDRLDEHPVVVTSAMSQITNLLISSADAALAGKTNTVAKHLKTMRDKHFAVATQDDTRSQIDMLLQKLERIYEGVTMLGELSPRSLDLISSFGERMSSWLMTERLNAMGVTAARLDSRELVRTDEQHGCAEVDWRVTKQQIKKALAPLLKKGVVPIVTGFIGCTADGQTTTLGRGGSDYSAAILGISLKAKSIQIWTDVDGMMTADPRVVKSAKMLPQISFQEAAELAYFGAKVLHPKTIQPAIDADIPVRILNTMNPDSPGTTILSQEKADPQTIKAIASKDGISIINICSSRMLGPHGFLAQIFNVFAHHGVSVDVLATTEVSVSVTVEDDVVTKALIQDLEAFSTTNVTPHQTIISVVGHGLKEDYNVEAKVFSALAHAKINNELISKGASRINLTFLVDSRVASRAVCALHDSLF